MRVEGRSGRQDDEVHDKVREEHTRQHIRACSLEFSIGRAAPLLNGAPTGGPILLDLLGGLPEEEIGRDRGPQDAHECGEVAVGPLNARGHGGDQDSLPVRSGQERGQDVGEQDEREPLEDAGNLAVGGPEEQGDDEAGIEGRPEDSLHAGHHLADLGHAAEVCPDIDDVGDDE